MSYLITRDTKAILSVWGDLNTSKARTTACTKEQAEYSRALETTILLLSLICYLTKLTHSETTLLHKNISSDWSTPTQWLQRLYVVWCKVLESIVRQHYNDRSRLNHCAYPSGDVGSEHEQVKCKVTSSSLTPLTQHCLYLLLLIVLHVYSVVKITR